MAQQKEPIKNQAIEMVRPVESPAIKKAPVTGLAAEKPNSRAEEPVKRAPRNELLLADQRLPSRQRNDPRTATLAIEKKDVQALSVTSQVTGADLPAQAVDSNQILARTMEMPPVEKKAIREEDLTPSFLVDDQTSDKKLSEKKVHFGVFAGTYLSYAKGSDNQFNVGAGISSDFKLSKNLKLSTGVAVLQNTFNYERNIPAASFSSPNFSSSEKLQLLSSPARSASQIKNYRANLVGLDIPINLKYEFTRTKNSLFIAAGFSSGTFINESYRYQYGDTPVMGFAGPVEEEKIEDKHFDNFNFAKTLNISFGSGYQLGKHNRLFIEPFVKYPLEGIGSENLRFGSGGINLRLNFQPSGK